jgi:hypothetical protein
MMASYIAFKALREIQGRLYSPCFHVGWKEAYVPFLNRFTYALDTPSLDGNQGVYAATLNEAWKYLGENCRLFLVIPSPDAETEIGTAGWRTTCAILLGEFTSLREAAKLILTSAQAGYPQVNNVLRWARFVTKPRTLSSHELIERSAEIRQLIRIAACGQYVNHFRNTQIRVIEGNQPPKLAGSKYAIYHHRLQSVIRSSDLRIEVGEYWPILAELTKEEQR